MNKKAAIAIGVAAVVLVGIAVGFGVHAHNEEMHAIEISEYNQEAEKVAESYREELARLTLADSDMNHDSVLGNIQDLNRFTEDIDADSVTYYDGSRNLYDALAQEAVAAIERDAAWMRDSYAAELAAIPTEGDDKGVLANSAAAAQALADTVKADAAVAEIWESDEERDAFVAQCTTAADAANARIAEIEKAEAEQKAKEEAERKAAEEEAAREAAEAAAATERSSSGSSSRGSGGSSGGSSGSRSSSSSNSSSGSSSSSGSPSSSDDEYGTSSINDSYISQEAWDEAIAMNPDEI